MINSDAAKTGGTVIFLIIKDSLFIFLFSYFYVIIFKAAALFSITYLNEKIFYSRQLRPEPSSYPNRTRRQNLPYLALLPSYS